MIGILGAMDCEVDLIKSAIENLEEEYLGGEYFYKGFLGDNEVVLTKCGVGKVNASISTTLLITQFGCTEIINTGIAGGVAPLSKRDVVLATKLCYHDFDATIFGYENGQVPGMPKWFYTSETLLVEVKRVLSKLGIEYKEASVISGDQFVTTMDPVNKIAPKGYVATEMEGAGVAQACTRFGISFISLRFISDIINSENQEEDYLVFEQEMGTKSANICIEVVKNIF